MEVLVLPQEVVPWVWHKDPKTSKLILELNLAMVEVLNVQASLVEARWVPKEAWEILST